jgi:REP element-mobilizing transposase RayT
MRKPRLTFPGAFHHVTCRGLNGEGIFLSPKGKNAYLDFLAVHTKRMGIRLLAYCLMDNHVHLIVENCSGRLSDCLRRINGLYGFWYRKSTGGAGYVFQGRFHSALIENDAYLLQAIIYVLNNPVRAKLMGRFDRYPWSSARYYFHEKAPSWLDTKFVEGLFGSPESMTMIMSLQKRSGTIEKPTKWGGLWGDPEFLEQALLRMERRSLPDAVKRKRSDDRFFEPVEKVIREFETKYDIRMEEIDVNSLPGKQLRSELLVLLKETTCLSFRRIAEMPIFSDIQFRSLGRLYQNARQK